MSDDLLEDLRRYQGALTDSIAPVPGHVARRGLAGATGAGLEATSLGGLPEPTLLSEASAHPSVDDPGAGRHRWLAAAAAMVVVALVAVAVWFGADGRTDPADRDVSSTTVPARPMETFGLPPGVTTLDPGPLQPRVGAQVVWTGTELVVIGGRYIVPTEEGNAIGPEPAQADGAAYDPVAGTWRSIAPAPVFLSGHAAWSGTEVIAVSRVLGSPLGSSRQAVAWDPITDTWRTLADAPPGVHTGDRGMDQFVELGLVAMGDGRVLLLDALSVYDPDTNSWAAISPPPTDGARSPVATHSPVWTGDRLLWLAVDLEDGAPALLAPSLAWDPATDSWRTFDPPPGTSLSRFSGAAWRGPDAVLVGVEGTAAALDVESGAWRALPRVPRDRPASAPSEEPMAGALPRSCDPTLWVQAGEVYVEACAGVHVLDRADRWRAVDLSPLCCGNGGGIVPGVSDFEAQRPVVAGDALFFWRIPDGPGSPRTAFDVWVPPEPVSNAPAGDD